MNCNDFNDLLREFLDETLDVEVLTEVREHLHQCDVCRQALQCEETLAQSIRLSLSRGIENLSLDAKARRKIREAVVALYTPVRETSSVWERLTGLLRQPAFAVAACLCLGFLAIVSNISRPATGDVTGKQYTCVINVPLQTQAHRFRREGGTVTDTMVDATTLGHAGY